MYIVYIMNEWNLELPKGSEIRCSRKSEHFPVTHVAPVTIHTYNYWEPVMCQHTLQHMWHKSVKFVNKEGLYDDARISEK